MCYSKSLRTRRAQFAGMFAALLLVVAGMLQHHCDCGASCNALPSPVSQQPDSRSCPACSDPAPAAPQPASSSGGNCPCVFMQTAALDQDVPVLAPALLPPSLSLAPLPALRPIFRNAFGAPEPAEIAAVPPGATLPFACGNPPLLI